jgi:hypothetical protein
MSLRRRRRAAGQAALELLAVVPLILAAAALAWQLVAVTHAGAEAQESARARALQASGAPGVTLTVRASSPVPALLPGLGGLSVDARAAVRAP